MEINRTQSLFQSHENIKLTIIFQLPSMLRYRPYFNVDSTLCACFFRKPGFPPGYEYYHHIDFGL